jgi:hypothetical protein
MRWPWSQSPPMLYTDAQLHISNTPSRSKTTEHKHPRAPAMALRRLICVCLLLTVAHAAAGPSPPPQADRRPRRLLQDGGRGAEVVRAGVHQGGLQRHRRRLRQQLLLRATRLRTLVDLRPSAQHRLPAPGAESLSTGGYPCRQARWLSKGAGVLIVNRFYIWHFSMWEM